MDSSKRTSLFLHWDISRVKYNTNFIFTFPSLHCTLLSTNYYLSVKMFKRVLATIQPRSLQIKKYERRWQSKAYKFNHQVSFNHLNEKRWHVVRYLLTLTSILKAFHAVKKYCKGYKVCYIALSQNQSIGTTL